MNYEQSWRLTDVFQHDNKHYSIKDVYSRLPISEEEVYVYNAASRYLENIHNEINKAIIIISEYKGPTNEIEEWLKRYPKPKDMLDSTEFQKAYLNLKNSTNVQLVPVSELIKFREFDRRGESAGHDDKINWLKSDMVNNGIKEPLSIEYSSIDNAVFLTEGNHRLNAAIELGIDYMPAKVITNRNGFSDVIKNKCMKVIGVKPNEHGFIPNAFKPSDIGLKNVKPLDDEWLYYGLYSR